MFVPFPRRTMTPQIQAQIDSEYRRWLDAFWAAVASLSQIIVEDFPGENVPATRYDIDALRDLSARIGAMVEGYERR